MSEEHIDNGLAILAPVPSVHLRAALAEGKPETAFGSDLDRLWDKDSLPSGRYRVYIYESHLDPSRGKLGATFQGVLTRWGRFEDIPTRDYACRPSTAESDTPWAFWWFVSDLEERPLLPFTELFPEGGTGTLKRGFIPHGPQKIDLTRP